MNIIIKKNQQKKELISMIEFIYSSKQESLHQILQGYYRLRHRLAEPTIRYYNLL